MKRHVSGVAGLAVVAVVGGVVLLLQAIVAVATSTPDSFTGTTSGYFSDGLSAAGLFLTIAGLIALRLVRATGDGRAGVTAIVLACAGQLGLVVSIAPSSFGSVPTTDESGSLRLVRSGLAAQIGVVSVPRGLSFEKVTGAHDRHDGPPVS